MTPAQRSTIAVGALGVRFLVEAEDSGIYGLRGRTVYTVAGERVGEVMRRHGLTPAPPA